MNGFLIIEPELCRGKPGHFFEKFGKGGLSFEIHHVGHLAYRQRKIPQQVGSGHHRGIVDYRRSIFLADGLAHYVQIFWRNAKLFSIIAHRPVAGRIFAHRYVKAPENVTGTGIVLQIFHFATPVDHIQDFKINLNGVLFQDFAILMSVETMWIMDWLK